MSWQDDSRGHPGSEDDEFDGDLTGLQEASRKSATGGMTRLEQLEHEMKLLSWHKLANEAALKAAIIRTKNLKQHDKLQAQKDRNREHAAWMEQIIREEQMKPLEVNTYFVKQYEQQEKEADAALERTIEHHLHNLRKLKESIEAKDAIRQRKEKFYAKREEVRERIQNRLATSRTGASTAASTGSSLAGPRRRNGGGGGDTTYGSGSVGDSSDGEEGSAGEGSSYYGGTTGGGSTTGGGGGGGGGSSAAHLVVGSLDKLLKLEKRINQLEQSVQEKAKIEQRNAGTLSQLGMLRFRKKKIQASLRAPAKTMFAVSMSGGNGIRPEGDDDEDDDDEGEEDQHAKVNNWMLQRKAQLAEQRKQREKRALSNRKKARQMGARNAQTVAADFKSMKMNDPRQQQRRGGSSGGGTTTLPPIRGAQRRQAW
jgi:hypothetical protein